MGSFIHCQAAEPCLAKQLDGVMTPTKDGIIDQALALMGRRFHESAEIETIKSSRNCFELFKRRNPAHKEACCFFFAMLWWFVMKIILVCQKIVLRDPLFFGTMLVPAKTYVWGGYLFQRGCGPQIKVDVIGLSAWCRANRNRADLGYLSNARAVTNASRFIVFITYFMTKTFPVCVAQNYSFDT